MVDIQDFHNMVCALMPNGDFLGMNVHEWHCNTEIKAITKDYITFISMLFT